MTQILKNTQDTAALLEAVNIADALLTAEKQGNATIKSKGDELLKAFGAMYAEQPLTVEEFYNALASRLGFTYVSYVDGKRETHKAAAGSMKEASPAMKAYFSYLGQIEKVTALPANAIERKHVTKAAHEFTSMTQARAALDNAKAAKKQATPKTKIQIARENLNNEIGLLLKFIGTGCTEAEAVAAMDSAAVAIGKLAGRAANKAQKAQEAAKAKAEAETAKAKASIKKATKAKAKAKPRAKAKAA